MRGVWRSAVGVVLLLAAGCPEGLRVDLSDVPEDVRPAVEQAVELRQGGEVDAAMAELNRALAEYPDSPFLYHHLARCAVMKSGQESLTAEQRREWFGRGIGYWQKAVAVDPDFYKANYNLGVIVHRQSERAPTPEQKAKLRAEARQRWEAAVRANPKFASAHYNLGKLAHAEGDDAQEAEQVDEAKAHWAEAQKRYEAALDITPRHIHARVNLAICLFHLAPTREEGLRLASEQWRKILEFARNNVYANFNLGLAATDRKDWDGALAYWRAATRGKPDDKNTNEWFLQSRAWCCQAIVYDQFQPDRKKALEAIRKAYSMDPDNREFRHLLRSIERGEIDQDDLPFTVEPNEKFSAARVDTSIIL